VTTAGAIEHAELACVPVLAEAVAHAATLAGLRPVAVPDAAELVATLVSSASAYAAVVVDGVDGSLADALVTCKALRRLDTPFAPIVLVVARSRLDELSHRDELYDDFVAAPVDVDELAARLRHVVASRGEPLAGSSLERGALAINLATYQATIAGRALDLTYMEYELLRFFASNPEQVFTREMLLSRVWGYEYYGGARTVDVHVRRLRAKLGEEHSHLIQTVRGVGYRLA
jgi:two-component system alkaline phosphatase synthesis response regulator PhoP